MSSKASGSGGSGAERRKSKRRQILSTFSFFVVVPNKGVHRLPVHDVSENGIGFDIDLDDEDPSAFPLKTGENLALHFYLNQSLFMPVSIRVMRIDEQPKSKVRRIGAEFAEKNSAGVQAMKAFTQMLDRVAEVAEVG